MTGDWPDLRVGPARARLEQLSHRAKDLPAGAQDIVQELLESCAIGVGELQVAAEELQQQHQELLAARQEVEVGRRRYRDLFELAPDGYLVTDPAGIITDANRAAVALLRVPTQELEGKPMVVYIAPDDRRRFHVQLTRLVEGRSTGAGEGEWELHVQPRRGPVFPAALSVSSIRDTQDGLTGLLWLLRDISASKRAVERERLLREARTQRRAAEEAMGLLAALMDAMPVGTVISDADGRAFRTNATARAVLGSDIRGSVEAPARLHTTHYPDGTYMPQEDMPLVHALRERQAIRNVEVLIRRADGEERTILAGAAPILDEKGEVVSGIAAFQDITEWRQAQAERERLAAILEATPDLVSMGTVDGELVYLNQAGLKMLGLPDDADLSKHTHPPGHADWASRLIQEKGIPAAIRDGVWRGSAAVLDGEGREIPVSEVVLAHRGPGGEVTYLSTIARDVSERERFLADLQEERARFAAIFETAPEAIIVVDADGRLQLANRAAHELYRRPVPFGSPFESTESVQVLHPDGRPFEPAEYPVLRSALLGEQVGPTATRVVWEDGRARDLLVSAAPLLDVDGGPSGSVSLIQDVTELNETQRALELLADRLRILHAADRVIISADSVDEIVEAVLPVVRELTGCQWACVVAFDGEASEAILLGLETDFQTGLGKGTRVTLDEGWPASELAKGDMRLVEDISDLPVSPSVVEDLRQQEVQSLVSVPLVVRGELLGALNLGLQDPLALTSEHHEIIRQMADQLAIGLRQMGLHEEVQRYAARLEEMVGRRTAALAASEARFRTIFEDSALGKALLDASGQIVATNPALQAMLDHSEEELVGTRLANYSHPEDAEADEDLFRSLVAGDLSFYHAEKRYVRKDGQVRWSELTVSRLTTAEADEQGLAIAMVMDITEKRMNQEALMRAERLAIAGRLGASLAHEINNPLQSVIGSLGLVEETLDERAEVRTYLELAMEELERAAGIVTQLRDLSREPKAREAKPSDLNTLIEKVLLLTRKDCLNRGVEVAWSPGTDLPAVPLAPERMRQVFLNLVLNAVEAMPKGGQLQVSTARATEPAGVSVFFADTGNGIEPDRLPQVFEPFHSSRAEGLGLGLYVSKNIVEEHGGHIDVDSRVGEGTTFTVWLPV